LEGLGSATRKCGPEKQFNLEFYNYYMLDKISLDEDMAEFCGVIMGDGNIWTNGRRYEVTITGSPKDRPYMDFLEGLVKRKITKPYYRIRGRGLRLTIYSKKFFMFLTQDLGMESGIRKSRGGIPSAISADERLACRFIRGFFDTDGSVFTSKKPGIPDYPTIEITNENKMILFQIIGILETNGITTTFRNSNSGTCKLALHGKKMMVGWFRLIGSSHPRKLAKMESIINGFH